MMNNKITTKEIAVIKEAKLGLLQNAHSLEFLAVYFVFKRGIYNQSYYLSLENNKEESIEKIKQILDSKNLKSLDKLVNKSVELIIDLNDEIKDFKLL